VVWRGTSLLQVLSPECLVGLFKRKVVPFGGRRRLHNL
jgi:hypothetical protein